MLARFPRELRGKIIEFAVRKLNHGYIEVSVRTYLHDLRNLMKRAQLVTFEGDEYHSATAETVDQAQELVEAGFEYVCQIKGFKVFRKRT